MLICINQREADMQLCEMRWSEE